MSQFRVLFGLTGLLWLLGCGQKTEPIAPAAPQAAGQTAAPAPEADYSAALAEMTQALRKFSAEQRRVPNSLNELVTAGYVKQLPPAPAGQSFAIDPKELKVVLK